MPLRVISGIAKGRKLQDVPGTGTRPVTDMVKGALFNILGTNVYDSTWWDLFGGTGAIGIEALSREAAFVRFTELDRKAVDTIKINLGSLGFFEQAEVRRGDAFSMLASPPDRFFDYIYIAPPQYKNMWSKALNLIDLNPGWLSQDAMAIVQIHPREKQDLELKNLVIFDERKYGSTLLIFYKVNPQTKNDLGRSVS